MNNFGGKAGPGRPAGVGNGRRRMLAAFDKLVAQTGNQQKLIAALQEVIDTNPLKFIREYLMPLTLPMLKDISNVVNESKASNLSTDSIILQMDQSTIPYVVGHRLRVPEVVTSEGSN